MMTNTNNSEHKPLSLTGRANVSAIVTALIGTIGGALIALVFRGMTGETDDSLLRVLPGLIFVVIAGVSVFLSIGLVDKAQAEDRYATRLAAESNYEKATARPEPMVWKPLLEAPAEPTKIDLMALTTDLIQDAKGSAFAVPLWKLQQLITIYPQTSRTACAEAHILTNDYGIDHQHLIGAAVYYGWLRKDVPSGKSGQGREAEWAISPMQARQQFAGLIAQAQMRARFNTPSLSGK